MNDTPRFPETAQPQLAPQKSRKKLVLTIIALSILLLGTWAAAAWLVSSGKVTVWETKAPVANSDGNLCQNLIAGYNKVFIEADESEFTNTLKQTADKAKAADPNESDPTCVYMRYTNASMTENNEEALRLANVLKALASQGAYMTAELANPQGIDAIMYTVQPEEATPASTNDEAVKGEG